MKLDHLNNNPLEKSKNHNNSKNSNSIWLFQTIYFGSSLLP